MIDGFGQGGAVLYALNHSLVTDITGELQLALHWKAGFDFSVEKYRSVHVDLWEAYRGRNHSAGSWLQRRRFGGTPTPLLAVDRFL